MVSQPSQYAITRCAEHRPIVWGPRDRARRSRTCTWPMPTMSMQIFLLRLEQSERVCRGSIAVPTAACARRAAPAPTLLAHNRGPAMSERSRRTQSWLGQVQDPPSSRGVKIRSHGYAPIAQSAQSAKAAKVVGRKVLLEGRRALAARSRCRLRSPRLPGSRRSASSSSR